MRLIDETRYDEQMRATVLPALAACCKEGWMTPAKAAGLPNLDVPGRLHYLCYDAARFDDLREDGATATFRGVAVISYGFTENARKYSELIWYLLLDGYSVCVLEHRGHGFSARDVDDPSVVWIDDWRRYVADLAKFAETVASQYAGERPMALYGHSMGGGIGAALLENHPTLFDKAVLSCPMIAPVTAGIPNTVAAAAAEAVCGMGFGRSRVVGQKRFSDQLDMTAYRGASEARVRWYHRQRCETPEYRTNAASYQWVREALRLSKAILDPQACARIETPIQLFQAGRDVWVLNEPENLFVRRVRDGGGQVRFERFPDSVHEIFSMPNAVLEDYYGRIFAFLDGSMDVLGGDEDAVA